MLGGPETGGVSRGRATQAIGAESPGCTPPALERLGGRARSGLHALCPGPEISECCHLRRAVRGPRELVRKPYNT